MIGPTVARELARQRELAILSELERPRLPRDGGFVAFLPSVGLAVAVVTAVALGAPT